MELTEREKTLITYGLFTLENQCFNDGDELPHEVREELIERGGVPDADETRALMEKIEKEKSSDHYTDEQISRLFQEAGKDLNLGIYDNVNNYAGLFIVGKQLQAEVKKLKWQLNTQTKK